MLVLAALAAPSFVQAQTADSPLVRFGLQGNWADEADFGVGARVQFDLDDVYRGLGAVASFDYFFPEDDDLVESLGVDTDTTYWEVNANATYTLRGRIAPYFGAGLNLAHGSVDLDVGRFELENEGDTELGVNLLGGVRFARHLFAEGRIELGGGEQFVLTAGFVF
jgi:opacity protein-like surface antigen